MDFDYTIGTDKSFDSAVDSVQAEIAKAGMKVQYVHDVQKSLAEKGFQREPIKIVEFCNAKYASKFLNADINVSLFMPCKINVYVKDGHVFISCMRPTVLLDFMPKIGLSEDLLEIENIIKNIVNNSK